MIHILSIVGARPQFIKLAPWARVVEGHPNCRHTVIHTGQHYDSNLSDIFFQDFEMAKPDFHLEVGSGSHGQQTGKMLEKIERVLMEQQPDMVVVFGDTNSTLAASLAAAKLHIPVAHIEAGLRSFNRSMPEEINRIVADHTADILLAPTPKAIENLAHEGLSDKTVMTGDIMLDAVLQTQKSWKGRNSISSALGLPPSTFGLVSVHRAATTDDSTKLKAVLNIFNQIAASQLPLIFPVHPRTRARIKELAHNWTPHPHLHLIDPVGYMDFHKLIDEAAMILTDSGGVQKEAFFHQRPCITLREETEWEETLDAGANLLTGISETKIIAAVSHWENRIESGKILFEAPMEPYFGKGNAAELTLNAIFSYIERKL